MFTVFAILLQSSGNFAVTFFDGLPSYNAFVKTFTEMRTFVAFFSILYPARRIALQRGFVQMEVYQRRNTVKNSSFPPYSI